MAKQKALPGIEEKITKIPHITKAAREYLETRDRKADATEAFKQASETLKGHMLKAKLDYYYCENQRIEVTHNDGIRVTKVTKLDDEGETAEDSESEESEVEESTED